jgi:hypothetical protein
MKWNEWLTSMYASNEEPKIGLPIEINHCPSEAIQAIKDGGLPHTKVLVKAVCRTSI